MTDPPIIVNLFENVSEGCPEEIIESLVNSRHARIERIVSNGQSSPPGFWYDQDEVEWVLLLQGSAQLEFAPDARIVDMKPGDTITIEPRQRHRVVMTSSTEPTIWLAVFFSPQLKH